MIGLVWLIGSSWAWANTMNGTGLMLTGDRNFYGGIPTGGGMVASSVGDYYISLPMSGGDLYRMSPGPLGEVWALAPWLLSITPNSGYNTAPVNVKISGANFLASTRIKLTRAGQSDIPCTGLTTGASEIYGTFNIAGAQVGFWTVTVEDENGLVGTLPNGFEVKTYTHDIALALNSPNPFDPARETTTIMYKLAQDTDVKLVIFSTTGDRLWMRDYLAGFNGGRAGDNSILWTGYTDFAELASNGVFLVHVVERATGKTLARGKVAVIRR